MIAIRQAIKQRRQQLSLHKQRLAAEQIAQQILRTPLFQRSRHIAFYIAHKGEPNLSLLIKKAWLQHKHTYLPALYPLQQPRLLFMPFKRESIFAKNRFGIDEPQLDLNHCMPAWALDIVFVPLVTFDENCHRIGMGMGYYDRTFSFITQRLHRPRPTLVGIAYEWQKINNFTPEPWDIPMDMVITEKKIYLRPPLQHTQ